MVADRPIFPQVSPAEIQAQEMLAPMALYEKALGLVVEGGFSRPGLLITTHSHVAARTPDGSIYDFEVDDHRGLGFDLRIRSHGQGEGEKPEWELEFSELALFAQLDPIKGLIDERVLEGLLEAVVDDDATKDLSASLIRSGGVSAEEIIFFRDALQ